MKELTTTLAKLLAIDVPEGATDFCLPTIYIGGTYIQWSIVENYIVIETTAKKLPPGQWQILGKGNEITEQQWQGIIPVNTRHGKDPVLYEDYTAGSTRYAYLLDNAKQAGLSLLTANGLTGEELILNDKNHK